MISATEIKINNLEKRLKRVQAKNSEKIDRIMVKKAQRIESERSGDEALDFVISVLESDMAECEIIALREKEGLLKVKLDSLKALA